MKIRKNTICFAELTPEQQAKWRAAYQQHATFSASSPAREATPLTQGNPQNICIDDLSSAQRAEWRESLSKKARL